MNAQQHIAAAEALLEDASHPQWVVTGDLAEEDIPRLKETLGPSGLAFAEGIEFHDNRVAAAQVHATLAVALAQIEARGAQTVHVKANTPTADVREIAAALQRQKRQS